MGTYTSLAARVGVFAMQDPLLNILGSWQYFLLMLQITVTTSLIEHLANSRRLGRNISACLVAVHWETPGSSHLVWDLRRVPAFLWPDSNLSVSLSTTSVIRNVSTGLELCSGCSPASTEALPLALQNYQAKTRSFSLLKLLLRCYSGTPPQ
ncbi:hypothetical protein AVEN_254012-1 [Araneus ventricosus]|uniref:Uncharacterized protein n=1 Tax=Araneus ventricosus TaxID=182803 RepID=A0A4Y2E845_ARAVE|nr:hypothetical protein AVEN_254012-1 [Araneus ventricosus]